MEIRRSYDRLISTMGFPILVRQYFYFESRPRFRLCSSLGYLLHCYNGDISAGVLPLLCWEVVLLVWQFDIWAMSLWYIYMGLCWSRSKYSRVWKWNIFSQILLNSLAPGRSGCDSKNGIFNCVLLIGIFRSSHGNAFWWMPQDLTDDKSTLARVMAWCRQATSHYLS